MLTHRVSPSLRHAFSNTALFVLLATPVAAQSTSIGLSTVRAQRFEDENLLFYVPAPGDHFGTALATGDFNGDGAEDLATGIPNHDNLGGFHPDSGIVVVRYGVPGTGLASGLADDVLSQAASGTPDPAEDGDHFGAALAACDWNGDGFDDLAVGIPDEDHLDQVSAGAVQVHFGSVAGLPAAGDTFYTQSTPGIPGDVEVVDRFGAALACGDFNADGFGDLVVGVPGESFGGLGDGPGMIDVIPGSALGLVPASATSLDQNSPGMAGEAESYDLFGSVLATGDFNADSFEDLIVGVPGEDNSGTPETGKGAVQIVFGSPSGLTAAGNQYRTDTGIGGLSEAGDLFGNALAVGDFDGDGFADAAIGIPFEDLGGNAIVDTGQVAVIYGAAAGFDFTRTEYWFQDNVVGATTSEANDRFGFALAAGDFDRDGYTDLAAGSPSEFVLVPDDGVVTVWMGTPTGLSAARNRSFARGYEGSPGPINQAARDFGRTLACGDFDGNGYTDLVAAAPFANGLAADSGDVAVFYGALFADGFETTNAGLWTATVP